MSEQILSTMQDKMFKYQQAEFLPPTRLSGFHINKPLYCQQRFDGYTIIQILIKCLKIPFI